MIRLPLDTTDPVQRRRVESVFGAAYSVRRAVQRDARARARAYGAAFHERSADPAAARERVGLSRTAFEHAAYAHLDGAPHLRRSLTKAVAMHLADSVWSATERHLFRDARGERHGLPRIGGWFDFTRIPGRARSHTTEHKWETLRLHGTLEGHRAAYASSDGSFYQPDRMRPVEAPTGWWNHAGRLAVVMTGLPIGTLVLPVRLPASPSNQPFLEHHLADPTRWHKIDLVRRRDPTAPGGWRYEAHLMVLVSPYVAPAVQAGRELAAAQTAGRRAGIDVNVSNVTVVSHASGSDLQITAVKHDASARRTMAARMQRQRRRHRRLDRSRRARNPDQYELSARQQEHNRRRGAAGLTPVQMVPKGARKRRANGTPLVAYRRDALSNTYRTERAAAACGAEATTQARRDFARQLAARFVRDHGCRFVVEDCDLRSWARLWGRGMAAFTPGTLLTALEREATLVAQLAGIVDGGVARASTRTTALSQRCLCGARVAKRLHERTHSCADCGLRGDRDAVAATLAACVVLADRAQPVSAELDLVLTRQLLVAPHTDARLLATLPYAVSGRQDVRSESIVHSAHDGSFVAEKGPTPDLVAVARRIAGTASYPTLDERRDNRRATTPDRVRMRTSLHRGCVYDWTQLRDSS